MKYILKENSNRTFTICCVNSQCTENLFMNINSRDNAELLCLILNADDCSKHYQVENGIFVFVG